MPLDWYVEEYPEVVYLILSQRLPPGIFFQRTNLLFQHSGALEGGWKDPGLALWVVLMSFMVRLCRLLPTTHALRDLESGCRRRQVPDINHPEKRARRPEGRTIKENL